MNDRRGHPVSSPHDRFTEEAFRRCLSRIPISLLEVHDVLPSTQTRALALADAGADNLTVVIAARQSAGRGRGGTRWCSPHGGLWASVILRPDLRSPARMPLTVPVSLAAARSLEALSSIEVSLKWPNDLYASERKLGGVLVDVRGPAWIIGIGVNLWIRRGEFPQEIGDVATSVLEEAGTAPSPAELLDRLLNELQDIVSLWAREEVAPLRSEAWRRSLLKGRRLRVHPVGNDSFEAIAEGLGENGELIVQELGGTRRSTLISGHIELMP
ncbi:biotin--[acetyl-CoA-carboxylase] ligase [Planctomycetota bacterium]